MPLVTAAEELLSIADVSQQLGVNPRTLRRYIKSGRIPVRRLAPTVVLIDPAEVRKFQQENLRVEIGAGVSYVPRPADMSAEVTVRPKPQPAAPARYT